MSKVEERRGYDVNPKRGRVYDVADSEKRFRRDEGVMLWRRGCDNGRNRNMPRSYNGRMHEDWKCMECFTWNSPDDYNCRKCRAPEGNSRKESMRSEMEETGNERGSSSERNDTDLDEFGRKRLKNGGKGKKAREWPPVFEKNGSSYVFDTRSAMFYEAETDFFYDPKSKLYYGNKKGAYYKYNPEKKKHFEQVEKTDSVNMKSSNETDLAPEAVLEAVKPGSNTVVQSKKPAISIKLTTKALKVGDKSKKSKAKTNLARDDINTVPMVSKQHAADIEKWCGRQSEIRKEEKANASGSEDEKYGKVAKTANGEPICQLCRRKFPTVEKLQYHEKASKLHKDNLAKQAAAKASQESVRSGNADSSKKYVDRAQQRRLLHGPEALSAATSLPTVITSATRNGQEAASHALSTTVPVAPDQTLGETNIGNQMLQKLGWKNGSNLGSNRQPNEQNASLANDWARIESIATTNGVKDVQRNGGAGR